MGLQFFAVHSEALATTHDALQRHASAHGLRPPGPTRALRIAQLFGHLQLRSAGRSSVVVALSEMAATWRFQARQLSHWRQMLHSHCLERRRQRCHPKGLDTVPHSLSKDAGNRA